MTCGKTHVILTDRHDADLVAECWDALIDANAGEPWLFRYGDAVARVMRGQVRVLNADAMGLALSSCVALERVTKRSTIASAVPAALERKLLVHPDDRLPELARVSHVPVLAPDGDIRETRGYDPKTGAWYEPQQLLPMPVPTAPTEEQVARARDFVLGELLGDFPFEQEADRANAFGLFLLPYARALIGESPTPLHLVTKPDVGAGATTLVQACLAPGLTRVPAPLDMGTSSEEAGKALLSKARAGDDSVFMDNVTTIRRQSGMLAQAITSLSIEGRILGQSQVVTLPFAPVWTATGNNPSITEELARRTCPIRLAVTSERPWDREGYRHPDLVGWARNGEARMKLTWAALCILRGWLGGGAARMTGTAVAGFAGWGGVIGGVLRSIGLEAFMANRVNMVEEGWDEEREGWQVAVWTAAQWGEGTVFLSEELHRRLLETGQLQQVIRTSDDPLKSLGMVLRRNRDKVVGGWTIKAIPGATRPRRWVVRYVGG